MKRILSTLIIGLLATSIYSQDSATLAEQIHLLKTQIENIKNEQLRMKDKLKTLESELPDINSSVGSLTLKIDSTEEVVDITKKSLDERIALSNNESSNKISTLTDQISKRTQWGFWSLCAILLASGLLYMLIKSKTVKDITAVEQQVKNTRKTIEEEQIQVNTKLAELYNGQMELLKAERQNKPAAVNAEVDHSLALKVADEITKMQMYLSKMDTGVRGYRSLQIALNNVFDNIKANGYDIIDHLHKQFNDGMNIDATMEFDEKLGAGEKIIKRVLRPEVHFNNKLIQRAQVIVATGE